MKFDRFTETPQTCNSQCFFALFSRRFREGISFPNFCGEVQPETASLQAVCCALPSTEHSTFRGEEQGEKAPRKGEEEGWPVKEAKRKKGRVKTSKFLVPRNAVRKKGFKSWSAANGGVTNGGLRGVWPPFLEIGRNRPFSPFFCLFRPFPEGAKSTWEIQKTEEKGLFPQISSDLLKTPIS